MKIYSWGNLLAGLAAAAAALWKLRAALAEWDAVHDMVWAGIFALLAVRALRAVLDQEAYEKDKLRQAARKRASRAMFGRWAPLMEWLGIILIWSALPLVYLRPGAWKLGLALLFGGLGYQLWLNVTLKRRMEEQKTQ